MSAFEEIDVQTAKEFISRGKANIVDIRGREVYEEGHIKNAFSVDDDNIEQFVRETDKNKPLVCYCYLGHSSKQAAQYFAEQGFTTVYSVIGGFTEWSQEFPDMIEAAGEGLL